MRWKIIIIGLVSILCATMALKASRIYASKKMQAEEGPFIVAKQLPVENGIIPVEIKQQKAVFKVPHEMEGLSFIIKNNTNKQITSMSTAYSVTTETDGKELADTFFLTLDTFIHPDVREAHRLKPIPPGGERLLQSDSVTGYEGANIKFVEVRLDYVEFEDKSTLGADTKGSQIIGQIREGAIRYKGWLVEKLRQNGRSVDALVPLLKDRKLPAELEFNSMHLNRGAGVYRSHMLDVYNTHGASELERFLNR